MIKQIVFPFLILLLLCSCKKDKVNNTLTTNNTIDVVKSYTYKELKPLLEKKDANTTYVVNFWATWCGPCVKELPYFEKIKEEYKSKNVEVLLVSLDFPKQVEKRLIPFINKHKIQSEVVLLDDVNEDYWIKDISEKWSGALPATIIYNTNNRKFYEQSFDYETLAKEVNTFLNL